MNLTESIHYTIRPATADDAPFVARAILEAVGFDNPPAEFIEKQARLCLRDDVLYSCRNTQVAEVGGRVVGSLTAYDGRRYRMLRAVTFPLIREMSGVDLSGMDDESGPGEYYLDSLYVLPEMRRRGIAKALVQKGLDVATALRLPTAALLVAPDNAAAARLYGSLGFRETGRVQAFRVNYRKLALPLSHPPLLEVCAASMASALTAARAGAPRIELCRRLDLGGLTPDRADIARCVKGLPLRTFVLVRPRGGDFHYSADEFAAIIDDIRYCRDAGAHGVVVGFLHADGTIDTDRCRQAVAAADGMEVTFHRAFDRCSHWPTALEQIIDCGFNRLLTSGQQPTAEQGIDTLRAIQAQAHGRIAILAGSGVNARNAAAIIQATGVNEVHGSCKTAGYESDEAEVRRTLAAIRG